MYRADENLFEEFSFADRKPAERSRPPQAAYSPRHERRPKSAAGSLGHRRSKRCALALAS